MAATTVDAYLGSKIVSDVPDARDIKQVKCAIIETAETAAQGDTYSFDMSVLGGTTLLGVYTNVHSTVNSILAANAITTAVVGTTVTFTIPAAGGTKKRVSKIFFQ